MLKKVIKYTDYNGVEREESFYFNISRAELLEMQMGKVGGFDQFLDRIVSSKDVPEIMKAFKEVIMLAYGEKSPDGKKFIKSKEISEAFAQTEAYSELLMSLLQDENTASDFINGIMPSMDRKPAELPANT